MKKKPRCVPAALFGPGGIRRTCTRAVTRAYRLVRRLCRNRFDLLAVRDPFEVRDQGIGWDA